MSRIDTLQGSLARAGPALTPSQKRFNTLLRKIEQARQTLAAWNEQRREAEAQQATQSVREVYRKLASALHPDRETDERQREAKTALMQRVNQACASCACWATWRRPSAG